ncbi:amino acid permease domain-containing protein [Ditylenchus destructor]|uniref:Amino acid permease domain-containing protein n=1 Tax=Ditylenchus destructor TaxID=166010 RepID=A0AAD4MWD1_9BILA|nr:amino acid permease domain-containing protein [Ditylenchus destructor]
MRTFVSRFEIVSAMAKLSSTGLIIIIGMYYLIVKGKTENLMNPFVNSTQNMGRIADAFFGGLFAYDGWDVLNFGVEELENPRRTMSFAIIVGMCTVAVVFCLMNLSFFVVLTTFDITSSDAVATTFSQQTMGHFQYIIPVLISLVLVGTFNGTMFAGSRWLFAASRQRQFPAFLSCVNPKHDSPRAALFVHVSLALAFSFIGNLTELVNYVGFCYWAQRVLTTSALLYIRIWKVPVHPEAIKTPIIIPIIFLIACTLLCIITIIEDFKTALVGLLMLGGAFIIYALFVWEKTLFRLKWYRRFAECINHNLCVFTQVTFDGLIELTDGTEEMDKMANLAEQRRSMNGGDSVNISTTPVNSHNGTAKRRIHPLNENSSKIMNKLPNDILHEVLGSFSRLELINFQETSKRCNAAAKREILRAPPKILPYLMCDQQSRWHWMWNDGQWETEIMNPMLLDHMAATPYLRVGHVNITVPRPMSGNYPDVELLSSIRHVWDDQDLELTIATVPQPELFKITTNAKSIKISSKNCISNLEKLLDGKWQTCIIYHYSTDDTDDYFSSEALIDFFFPPANGSKFTNCARQLTVIQTPTKMTVKAECEKLFEAMSEKFRTAPVLQSIKLDWKWHYPRVEWDCEDYVIADEATGRQLSLELKSTSFSLTSQAN